MAVAEAVYIQPYSNSKYFNTIKQERMNESLLIRNDYETNKLLDFYTSFEKKDWDLNKIQKVEINGQSQKLNINNQLPIFSELERRNKQGGKPYSKLEDFFKDKEAVKYLREEFLPKLFEKDIENEPYCYMNAFTKGKHLYVSKWYVFAMDLPKGAVSQIGDVEQIVTMYDIIGDDFVYNCDASKKHYYPDSIKYNGKWAFDVGTHLPFKVNETKVKNGNIIKINNKNYRINLKENNYCVPLSGFKTEVLHPNDCFPKEKMKLVLKLGNVRKSINIPYFKEFWSYNHPDLMFDRRFRFPVGKLCGGIDAATKTF